MKNFPIYSNLEGKGMFLNNYWYSFEALAVVATCCTCTVKFQWRLLCQSRVFFKHGQGSRLPTKVNELSMLCVLLVFSCLGLSPSVFSFEYIQQNKLNQSPSPTVPRCYCGTVISLMTACDMPPWLGVLLSLSLWFIPEEYPLLTNALNLSHYGFPKHGSKGQHCNCSQVTAQVLSLTDYDKA